MARFPGRLSSSAEDSRADQPGIGAGGQAEDWKHKVVAGASSRYRRFSLALEALWNYSKTMEMNYEQAAQQMGNL